MENMASFYIPSGFGTFVSQARITSVWETEAPSSCENAYPSKQNKNFSQN